MNNMKLLIILFLVIGFGIHEITKAYPRMPAIFKFLIEVGYVLTMALCFLKISHVI